MKSVIRLFKTSFYKLFLILPVLFFSACLFGQDHEYILLEKEKYTLKYPKEWKVTKSDVLIGPGLFLSSIDSPLDKEKDTYLENIMVIYTENKQRLSLTALVDGTMNMNAILYAKNHFEIKYKTMQDDYIDAKFTYLNPINNEPMTQYQRYYLKNGIFFGLSFSEETKVDAKYSDIRNAVFKNFIIK